MAARHSVLPPQGDHKDCPYYATDWPTKGMYRASPITGRGQGHSPVKFVPIRWRDFAYIIIAHQVAAQLAQWVAYNFYEGA